MSVRHMLRVSLVVLVLALATVSTASAAPPPALSRPSAAFLPPSNCGCHGAFVQTWQKSMHAKALSDPIYQTKQAQGQKATGGKLGNFCNSCHGPVATMSGEINGTDMSKLSPSSAAAISCDFCHQVDGSRLSPPRDASYSMSTDGKRLGPLADAKAPHPWAGSDFIKTSEFCGNCHNVTHPGNGTHLEGTFGEWKKSPYAAQGVTCQDCHMTPGPGVTKPNPGQACVNGPQREMIYNMTWAGGNVALGDPELADANLKAAATLDVSAPKVVDSSGKAQIVTNVTNTGAGHDLPTGLTEVRQMWLEVVATDKSGKEIKKVRRDFGTQLKDAKGNHPVEMWDATGIYSDDRIAPMQSKGVTITVPVASDGSVTVKAALYYRTAPKELAAQSGVDIPTTTMATTETAVYATQALADKAAAAAPAAPAAPVAPAPSGQSGAVPLPALLGGVLLVVVVGGGVWWFGFRKPKPTAKPTAKPKPKPKPKA